MEKVGKCRKAEDVSRSSRDGKEKGVAASLWEE
jgi:hypothetical protein